MGLIISRLLQRVIVKASFSLGTQMLVKSHLSPLRCLPGLRLKDVVWELSSAVPLEGPVCPRPQVAWFSRPQTHSHPQVKFPSCFGQPQHYRNKP